MTKNNKISKYNIILQISQSVLLLMFSFIVVLTSLSHVYFKKSFSEPNQFSVLNSSDEQSLNNDLFCLFEKNDTDKIEETEQESELNTHPHLFYSFNHSFNSDFLTSIKNCKIQPYSWCFVQNRPYYILYQSLKLYS